MRAAAIFVILAGSVRATCLAVASDRILARDLSTAIPFFQALDPEAIIGFSPFPGTVRLLSPRDLQLAARSYGLTFPITEPSPSVCVERIVRSLSVEDLREAMLAALETRQGRLEILEFSNKLVPPGRLTFQLAALNKPPGNNPQTPVIWPGKLVYDDRHSVNVWAKVRISVDHEVFLAKDTIPRGGVIGAEQITATRVPEFPLPVSPILSSSGIVGKVARRTIAPGQRISPEVLNDPGDVLRGETVHVKVVDGSATVTLDAIAQSSGSKGENILVYNPSSGRSFHALIDGRSRAVVLPSGSKQ